MNYSFSFSTIRFTAIVPALVIAFISTPATAQSFDITEANKNYIQQINNNLEGNPLRYQIPDDHKIVQAYQICVTLNNGVSMGELQSKIVHNSPYWKQFERKNLTQYFAAIIVNSVYHYCPNQKSKL